MSGDIRRRKERNGKPPRRALRADFEDILGTPHSNGSNGSWSHFSRRVYRGLVASLNHVFFPSPFLVEGKRDRSAIDFFGFGQELLNSFPSVKDIAWKRLEVRSSVHVDGYVT